MDLVVPPPVAVEVRIPHGLMVTTPILSELS